MMQTTLNGMQARRYATYGRAAGIAVLVCAGGLWAWPLPGMKELPAKPVPVAPPTVADPAPVASANAKLDAVAIDDIATRLDMAVVKAEKPVEPDVNKPVPPDAPVGPEWTYLGPIHESSRSLAIIAVDGHQKILAEGRTFGDTKLISVEDTGINVEVKGTPKRIDRGHRSGSTVAWVRNLQNNTPATRVAAGQPGGGPGNNLPPEVRARLAERGITPEQMANWRGNAGRGNAGGGPGGGGQNGDRRNRATPGGDNTNRGGGGPRGDATPQDQPVQPTQPVKPLPAKSLSVDSARSIN